MVPAHISFGFSKGRISSSVFRGPRKHPVRFWSWHTPALVNNRVFLLFFFFKNRNLPLAFHQATRGKGMPRITHRQTPQIKGRKSHLFIQVTLPYISPNAHFFYIACITQFDHHHHNPIRWAGPTPLVPFYRKPKAWGSERKTCCSWGHLLGSKKPWSECSHG